MEVVCCRIAVGSNFEGDVSIINIDMCDCKDCHEGNTVLASIIPEGRAEDLVFLHPAVESLVSGTGLVHRTTLRLGVGHPPVYVLRRNGPAISPVRLICNNQLQPGKVALQLALEDAQVIHLSTGEWAVERDDVAGCDADSKLVPEAGSSCLVSKEAGIHIIIPGPGLLDGAVCSVNSNEAAVADVSSKSVLPADLWKKGEREC